MCGDSVQDAAGSPPRFDQLDEATQALILEDEAVQARLEDMASYDPVK